MRVGILLLLFLLLPLPTTAAGDYWDGFGEAVRQARRDQTLRTPMFTLDPVYDIDGVSAARAVSRVRARKPSENKGGQSYGILTLGDRE